MNLSQAQKILGYDIDLNPVEQKLAGGKVVTAYEAAANWEHGTQAVTARTRQAALELLILRIYGRRADWVRRAQRFRCANCGELGPLEIDHIIPRSKGRKDVITNLRAICPSGFGCKAHQKKHG